MDTLVRIEAQYYENYGSSEAPYWKPKGGQEFTIRIDSDILFYNKEGVASVLSHMLDDRSGDYIRYELLSFEPVFGEPIALDSNMFNTLYDADVDNQHELYVEGIHYNRPETISNN